MGELMLAFATRQCVAGVVINSAVLDLQSIRLNELPVYAAGFTHRGPYKVDPGEVNVSVSIDGMVIEAGDLLIWDGNGGALHFVHKPRASSLRFTSEVG